MRGRFIIKSTLPVALYLAILTGPMLSGCRSPEQPFECTDAIGCVRIAPGEPVRLGLLVDMSGGATSFGQDQARATEIAVERRGGRLLGHRVELRKEDSRCSPEGGRVAASKLVTEPQLVALLGTTCSTSAAAAAKVMAEEGFSMVSGVNSGPSLTSIAGLKGVDWQPGYFRTSNNNTGLGKLAADFASRGLGLRRAATVNDGDAYSKGLTEVFERTFSESGGEVVLDVTINKGDTDMKPALAAIAASGAKMVFLPLFEAEAIPFVRQAGEIAGLDGIVLVGAGALLTPSFAEEVGEEGKGMYFSRQASPKGQESEMLRAEFLKRYGRPPRTNAYAASFDAAALLLGVIEEAAIRENDGTLHIGRQALRDALYATSGFEGASGRIACDPFGDCGVPNHRIVRLDDPAAGVEGLKANLIWPSPKRSD